MPATKTKTPRNLELSREVRRHFDPAVVNTAYAMMPRVVAENAALVQRFFELAARYDLDPLTGEIWLAAMKGRNSGPRDLQVLVGRDGYMKIARRHPDFVSCFGQPVYEGDDFQPKIGKDHSWTVRHNPVHPKDRGELTGAYALLIRRGAPTLYFFAPIEQYKKDAARPSSADPEKEVRTPWHYTDAMSVKCAMSYLLRTTYGVSGPVPYDEVSVGFSVERGIGGASDDTYGEPVARLPESIETLYGRIRSIDAHAFNEGELRARVLGATPAALKQVEHELEEWLREHEPADAEVVGDDAPVSMETRWDAETEDFRQAVRGLYLRRDELETALAEIGHDDPRSEEITAELDSIEGRLGAEYQVPTTSGWRPPPESQEATRSEQ